MAPGDERELPTFRTEAVAHRGRFEEAGGELVPLVPNWTSWAFYAISILVVAAVVVLSVVDVNRYARGVVGADGTGRLVVLLPASQAPDVAEGSSVELGGSHARVTSFRDEIVYPPEAQERFGIQVTVPSVAALTDARSAGELGDPARVLVESQPMIVALVPGLEGLLEDRDG